MGGRKKDKMVRMVESVLIVLMVLMILMVRGGEQRVKHLKSEL